MPFHQIGTYDGFDSIEEVLEHYSKKRNIQYFKFSEDTISGYNNLRCTMCRKRILPETGHRGEYWPKYKKVVVFCHKCTWKTILHRILSGARHYQKRFDNGIENRRRSA